MDAALPLTPFLEEVFIDRAQELETLREWSTKPGSRVLLVGPAGIGKTALLYMFVRRFGDLFPCGVVHLSPQDFADPAIEPYPYDLSTPGQRLVILDDADAIPEQVIIDLVRATKNSQTSLIVSGRRAPIGDWWPSKTIKLSGLDMAALVQARLLLLPDAPEAGKVLRFIEGNPFLSMLVENPRRALAVANRLSSSAGKWFPVYRTERKVTAIKPPVSVDVISIVVAIILFLFAQVCSNKSEERILDRMQELQQVFSEAFTEQKSATLEKPHVVSTFLTLREAPTINPDNVITILMPGQMIDLVVVSSGWAKVTLIVPGRSKKVEGWVYSKYLNPAEDASHKGLK